MNENLVTANAATTGTVEVTSDCRYIITGSVNTAFGRVDTTVASRVKRVKFDSLQNFNVATAAIPEIQDVNQTSSVDSETTTQLGLLQESVQHHRSFPLKLNYSLVPNADGTYTQKASSDQRNATDETKAVNGFPPYHAEAAEQVQSTIRWSTTPPSRQLPRLVQAPAARATGPRTPPDGATAGR